MLSASVFRFVTSMCEILTANVIIAATIPHIAPSAKLLVIILTSIVTDNVIISDFGARLKYLNERQSNVLYATNTISPVSTGIGISFTILPNIITKMIKDIPAVNVDNLALAPICTLIID